MLTILLIITPLVVGHAVIDWLVKDKANYILRWVILYLCAQHMCLMIALQRVGAVSCCEKLRVVLVAVGRYRFLQLCLFRAHTDTYVTHPLPKISTFEQCLTNLHLHTTPDAASFHAQSLPDHSTVGQRWDLRHDSVCAR